MEYLTDFLNGCNAFEATKGRRPLHERAVMDALTAPSGSSLESRLNLYRRAAEATLTFVIHERARPWYDLKVSGRGPSLDELRKWLDTEKEVTGKLKDAKAWREIHCKRVEQLAKSANPASHYSPKESLPSEVQLGREILEATLAAAWTEVGASATPPNAVQKPATPDVAHAGTGKRRTSVAVIGVAASLCVLVIAGLLYRLYLPQPQPTPQVATTGTPTECRLDDGTVITVLGQAGSHAFRIDSAPKTSAYHPYVGRTVADKVSAIYGPIEGEVEVAGCLND